MKRLELKGKLDGEYNRIILIQEDGKVVDVNATLLCLGEFGKRVEIDISAE